MEKNKYEKAYENFLLAVNCNAIFMDKVMWQDFETLKELVDQTKTPTLEEVQKEWEELGYEWRMPKEYPHMIWLVNDDDDPKWVLTIKINTQTKKYWKRWGDNDFERFTFQEHQLLTKTFKALEKEE